MFWRTFRWVYFNAAVGRPNCPPPLSIWFYCCFKPSEDKRTPDLLWSAAWSSVRSLFSLFLNGLITWRGIVPVKVRSKLIRPRDTHFLDPGSGKSKLLQSTPRPWELLEPPCSFWVLKPLTMTGAWWKVSLFPMGHQPPSSLGLTFSSLPFS
jgi:hypothetical protein